jgi:hypothetical protein
MTARAIVDPRQEMALFHRILVGTAVFFVALLIGVQITRATGISSHRSAGELPGVTAAGR